MTVDAAKVRLVAHNFDVCKRAVFSDKNSHCVAPGAGAIIALARTAGR